jgi:hypothetical protein
MAAFQTPTDVARSFIKGYYVTTVDHPEELYKFYSPSAVVIRDGVPIQQRLDISATSRLALNAPTGSRIAVANYAVAQFSGSFHIAATGLIDLAGKKRAFSQNFILQDPIDADANLWIVSDILSIFDDAFFTGVRFDGPSEPPPVAAAQPKPPQKSKQKPNRQGRTQFTWTSEEEAPAPAASTAEPPPPAPAPQPPAEQEPPRDPQDRRRRGGKRGGRGNRDQFTWVAES